MAIQKASAAVMCMGCVGQLPARCLASRSASAIQSELYRRHTRGTRWTDEAREMPARARCIANEARGVLF